MPKRINKKMFLLLFVIATLAQHGSTMPMLSNPCQKKPTGTTIQDIPSDCLHEIFKFVHPGSLLTLSFVCKNFKQEIKAFHVPYPFEVNCKNQEIGVFYGNIIDNTKELVFKNINFERTKIIWPSKLQKLSIECCKNLNYLSIPKSENLHTLRLVMYKDFNGQFLDELTKVHTLRTLHTFFFFGFCENPEAVKKLQDNGCEIKAFMHEPLQAITPPASLELNDCEQPQGLLGWLTCCWQPTK